MKWNRGEGPGTVSSSSIMEGPTEFLVTPLLMGPVCLFIQSWFEEPVRHLI